MLSVERAEMLTEPSEHEKFFSVKVASKKAKNLDAGQEDFISQDRVNTNGAQKINMRGLSSPGDGAK